MPERLTKPKPMFGWYDPGHLLQTGIRVGIATVFGEFLDRRELFGDRNAPVAVPGGVILDKEHDYSEVPEGGLWLDYLADTGDGWDSTYTVARLLAREKITFWKVSDGWHSPNDGTGPSQPSSACSRETKRGRVVVFGGDQVYATASRNEYQNRMKGPFDKAVQGLEMADTDMYAVPGNHDWYDGLNSFMGLFVARRPGAKPDAFGGGRTIGGRRTKQTRSYFALRLPGNWWLLGVDAQLTGYIDRGQIAFFDEIAQNCMEPGSNIILCASMPSWAYVNLDGTADKIFRNYSYLENTITGMVRTREPYHPKTDQPRLHNLRLVLTGDSHHYTRFIEGPDDEKSAGDVTEVQPRSRCYLTWGGGGAFLHPTQQLGDVQFAWDHPPAPPLAQAPLTGTDKPHIRDFKSKWRYPSCDESKHLSNRIPFFGFNNPSFSVLMALFGLVVAWALAGTAVLADQTLPGALRQADSFCQALGQLLILMGSFPWAPLTCVALIGALTYFSAAHTRSCRLLIGFAHFTAYFLSFFILFVAVARFEALDNAGMGLAIPLVLSIALAGSILKPCWPWQPLPSRLQRFARVYCNFVCWAVAMLIIFFVIQWWVPVSNTKIWSPIFLVLIVAIGTGVIAPLIMGCYLWVSLRWFGRHWNEAFSSLRIRHYKGFLRLHFDKNGDVTVYPIAIDKVPLNGERPLNARLIEQPIRLKAHAPLPSR